MKTIELDYSQKIDCRLDYSNTEEMILFFKEAKLISSESVYRFLEELGRPPLTAYKLKSLKKNIEHVLKYVDTNFHHPLKEIALSVIRLRLDKKYLPIKKVLMLMSEIRKYPQYYSILSMIYFSSRRNGNIKMVEDLYNSIIQEWTQRK